MTKSFYGTRASSQKPTAPRPSGANSGANFRSAAEQRDEVATLHFGHGDFLPDAHPAAYRREVG